MLIFYFASACCVLESVKNNQNMTGGQDHFSPPSNIPIMLKEVIVIFILESQWHFLVLKKPENTRLSGLWGGGGWFGLVLGVFLEGSIPTAVICCYVIF